MNADAVARRHEARRAEIRAMVKKCIGMKDIFLCCCLDEGGMKGGRIRICSYYCTSSSSTSSRIPTLGDY